MKVKIKKLNAAVKLPSYAHPGDAGLDLYSLEDYELRPGERHIFFSGFALEFPNGYVAKVFDKGGLPKNYGLHALGGVFDAGYRGEYNVNLVNLGQEPYQIKKGDKIAQLVILPCEHAEFEETEALEESQRGEGRFGSSGR
ncbi:MAG: dUTP diphosphatase [Candidatus Komeilibacteria bacterium]|nr:dUTP diphosphatase [Candidatus Komeilibacteria bacterium]